MNTTAATVTTTSTYLAEPAQAVEVDGVRVATVISGWKGVSVNVLGTDGAWVGLSEVRSGITCWTFRDSSTALQAALAAIGATSVVVAR